MGTQCGIIPSILWNNQMQKDRKTRLIYIVIHLRPYHRKCFHAKYTYTKLVRRLERGKKVWFTA